VVVLVAVPGTINEQLLELVLSLDELDIDGGFVEGLDYGRLVFGLDFRFETVFQ
jgi:hypothetical protein